MGRHESPVEASYPNKYIPGYLVRGLGYRNESGSTGCIYWALVYASKPGWGLGVKFSGGVASSQSRIPVQV
jgi:hypothetical protein